MTCFKCICCGEESTDKRPLTCQKCGHKMYEMPYDKKGVLIDEIRKFIKKLRLNEFKIEQLGYYRFEKTSSVNDDEPEKVYKTVDDERFPNFDKIQGFIVAAEKTEKFIERMNASLEQIQKHYHTPYKNNYMVDFQHIVNVVDRYDEVLNKAVSMLNLNLSLEEPSFGAVTVEYEESTNPDTIALLDGLIDNLRLLVEKISKFIKLNNIYGNAYQYMPNAYRIPKGHFDILKEISKVNDLVVKAINKKYIVDIFSDGTEELHDMLDSFWEALSAVMLLPIQNKIFLFQFESGEFVAEKEFSKIVLTKFMHRYFDLDKCINDNSFLPYKTEIELFDLYNKMVEIDSFGFIGIKKEDLLITGTNENKLNSLIGLANIKESILKIKSFALSNKDAKNLNLHMCFYGNPGTGKTEVARIIAGILYENKILPTPNMIEVDRSDLVGQYVGETPIKTSSVIASAMGGVLFIDEAYSLASKDAGFDYGHEAVATLIKAMEDYRGKFCVVLAGYKNQMNEMISTNPGFKSRIQFELDFQNYSRHELGQITDLMLNERNYSMDEFARSKLLDITDIKRKEPNFATAREVRNILDQVIMCQNVRTLGSNDRTIGIVDVNRYIKDSKINLPMTGEGFDKKILTAEEELEQLVGLDATKRMVKKIKAYAKRNSGDSSFNLHMCFYGNPGTGKTEVARIISRILYDAGVLSEAKLVETDAHGLIGKFVGETAPKTKTKVDDAMGGVLFIDEAYSLVSDSSTTSYGEEAISTLLKEMEDHRGQFCTIFAGYKNEIKNMLSTNPGLESRIQFTLEFPDYTREELCEIAQCFLTKKKYTIDDNAMDKVLDITDYYRERPNFANARTIRNILDQVIMNQNLRTEDLENNTNITLSDVEDYILDEGINFDSKPIKMGF